MLNPKKIKTLLDKINWLSNSFEENNYANISALEKSLLKEKVLMFFDEIENIPTAKTQNRVEEATQKVNLVAETAKPKEVEVEKVAPIQEQVVEELKPEPVPVPEVQKIVEEHKPIVEEKKPEPVIVEKPKEPILANEEKFQKTEAFQKQIVGPKRDLREIIDLNKSFILKAELFNQNNDLYNQFISEMNQTRSEAQAEILLNNWLMKMNWNKEENKAYELLERAVEKRFLPLI